MPAWEGVLALSALLPWGTNPTCLGVSMCTACAPSWLDRTTTACLELTICPACTPSQLRGLILPTWGVTPPAWEWAPALLPSWGSLTAWELTLPGLGLTLPAWDWAPALPVLLPGWGSLPAWELTLPACWQTLPAWDWMSALPAFPPGWEGVLAGPTLLCSWGGWEWLTKLYFLPF